VPKLVKIEACTFIFLILDQIGLKYLKKKLIYSVL